VPRRPGRSCDQSASPGSLCASSTTRALQSTIAQISDILDAKGSDVIKIASDATVFDAVKLMVEANIGALLVTDGEQVVGIFTERDYLRRIAVEGRRSRDTTIRDVMSSPVIVITPATTVEESMAVMSERRIRHAPVLDSGNLVGMISIGDLVKHQSKQQSFQIQYLTDYISAR